ncbi:UDP-glucosyltransferase 2-like [Phlebotomus argentipes]|uniref:UDP-glucosyltransferase 2-like n=1 Tax=Phlebotomus argentipes TaxID=94469 RepID=UPI002892CBC0|nr:UDP-glucosyltransferase 2-like [Phlebotomus argentipes]
MVLKMKNIFFLSFCLTVVTGYNILGVFHTGGKSHYILGAALMKGLADAGHNVTIVAPFRHPDPSDNMREVVITSLPNIDVSKSFLQEDPKSFMAQVNEFIDMFINMTHLVLTDPAVVDLMQKREKFDVIIQEIFLAEAMLGFGKHFDAPIVGFSTFGASKWNTDLNGSPSPPSYVANVNLVFSDRMTFFQRFINIITMAIEEVYFGYYFHGLQVELYNKYFPEPKPTLEELKATHVSLVLLNSHFSLGYPRPYLPNMIEIGGFHVNKKPKSLPKDLQEFLDNSPNGVVYFSLGSNLKSADLPTQKRDDILKVLGTLNVNVMWKWEDDNLPNQPKNVLIRKWFPQDDILAHPNVRLFITHGGLLSTMESIYHGVPILGIPIFADQHRNSGTAQAAGYGLTVTYTNLTEESISWAINELLSNDKYSIRAKTISARFRDQPEDPMSRAVYWIEYVARHGGAKHLISGGQELSFIQYHNLDVFALLLAVPLLIFVILKRMFRKLMKKICKRTCKENLTKKLK